MSLYMLGHLSTFFQPLKKTADKRDYFTVVWEEEGVIYPSDLKSIAKLTNSITHYVLQIWEFSYLNFFSIIFNLIITIDVDDIQIYTIWYTLLHVAPPFSRNLITDYRDNK